MENRTTGRCACGSLMFIGEGFGDVCPECQKKERKREKESEKNRRWYVAHPETRREYGRRRQAEHPEKVREEKRRWKQEHPEIVRESNRRSNAAHPERVHKARLRHRERHPGYDRDAALRRRFGIGQAEIGAMLAAQGGRCGICATTEPPGKLRWCLDHDHHFAMKDPRGHRGVLCHPCNMRLTTRVESRSDLLSPAEAAYLDAVARRRLTLVGE